MPRRRRARASDRAPATRVLGYCRVSTSTQAEEGVSLEAQAEQLQAYAELYELELVEVLVDDGESAATLERPGLARALERLDAGDADGLLVPKLDRLTRSVRDLGDLLERGFASGRWALLSVAEAIDTRSAAGRLLLNVLVSVAQWEREAIGERTSAAMAHMRRRGLYTGGIPRYGFALGDAGELEPVEEEQRVVTLARRLRRSGKSLRAIASRLEDRGWRSRAGQPFSPTQVLRMVA